MRVVEPSIEIVNAPEIAYKKLEEFGRECYQSWDKVGPGTDEKFVRMIMAKGHTPVLEHLSVTVRIVTSRDVSHELVRHRIAAYCQQSQRYYAEREHVDVIKPWWLKDAPASHNLLWEKHAKETEDLYHLYLLEGRRPEEARVVLTNYAATRMVATMNFRAWRHTFFRRTAADAYAPMRSLMLEIEGEFKKRWPLIFTVPFKEGH